MEIKFTESLSMPKACKQWLVSQVSLHALLTSLVPLTIEKLHITPLPTPKTSDYKTQLRPKLRDFIWEITDEQKMRLYHNRTEISSVGQSTVLVRTRLWVWSSYRPFTQELDSMILVGPCQLRTFCDLWLFCEFLSMTKQEQADLGLQYHTIWFELLYM